MNLHLTQRSSVRPFESIDKGQVEAASALGMNYFQALIRIILPEAIVVALPSLGNAFIGLIKGTSLAFVCSVVEMTAEGKILAGRNYRYFEVYISLAIIYWVITFVLERVISYLEKAPGTGRCTGTFRYQRYRGGIRYDRNQKIYQKHLKIIRFLMGSTLPSIREMS